MNIQINILWDAGPPSIPNRTTLKWYLANCTLKAINSSIFGSMSSASGLHVGTSKLQNPFKNLKSIQNPNIPFFFGTSTMGHHYSQLDGSLTHIFCIRSISFPTALESDGSSALQETSSFTKLYVGPKMWILEFHKTALNLVVVWLLSVWVRSTEEAPLPHHLWQHGQKKVLKNIYPRQHRTSFRKLR